MATGIGLEMSRVPAMKNVSVRNISVKKPR